MELIISIISIGIALFALGWNVYKDIIMKPKFKASFGVYTPATISTMELHNSIILFKGVNFGPGDLVISNIILKYKNRKNPYSIVIPNMQWKTVPQKVQVGEEVSIFADYNKKCFLSTDFVRAGLIDSFGRYHWVSRDCIKQAKDIFKNEFNESEI